MTHQEVPHCPHVAAVGVQVPRDQPARRPQPRDHGRVLRARPQSRLLAAAVEHRGHGDTLAVVENADAGTVELVAHDGDQVGAELGPGHGDLANGLGRVRVEQDRHPGGRGRGAEGGEKLLDGLQDPGLVVGHHHGDETRVGGHGLRNLHLIPAPLSCQLSLSAPTFSAGGLRLSHRLNALMKCSGK